MSEKHKRLRPCPFCSGINLSRSDSGGVFWVKCHNKDCGCEGPVCRSKQDAIEAWNIRVLPEPDEPDAAHEARMEGFR